MNNKTRGRKRLENQKQIRRNITLSDRLADKARKISGRSVSDGIRIALEQHAQPE